MKWSLRNPLLFPVLGLIIIGMGTLTGASYYNSKTDLERAITGQISQLADSAHSALGALERLVYKVTIRQAEFGRGSRTVQDLEGR